MTIFPIVECHVNLNNAFLLVSMKEMICRLCLQTIADNDCQPVEESVLKFLKLNINVSKENVMCVECANGLQVFSNNFTPGCAYTEDETLPLSDLDNGVKLEPEPVQTTSNPESLMKTEIKCSFCAKTYGGEDLTSLQISREHKFLLEQYFSEANLKNTKELLTCESCLGSLEGVWSVILKCLEVEEKISKYIELKVGTDDKGRVELKEVQQFMFGPTIKSEIESLGVDKLEDITDRVQEEYTGMAEAEIKYGKGISNAELIIKKEDDDTESEQSDCDIAAIKSEQGDGFQELFTENKCPSTIKMFQCGFCSYQTKWKGALAIHVSWIHKKYKCELCLDETKHISHLEHHSLTHKNPSEINMLKYEMCSYEAKRETYLKTHLLTHKNPFEVNRFKCKLCSYEGKCKGHLEDHLLTHKSPSEIKMFKCEICSYEAKRIRNLRSHLLTHKNPSEIKMFKCELCSYEAKRKCELKRHLLIHESPSEVNMLKCEMCPYKAKHKTTLRRHLLTHKNTYEIKMFKCALCSYEAKWKCTLEEHLLTHRSPSEIKMFQCELCSYEAKRKVCLKRHLLTHKEPSEIKMFKCEVCPYETIRKDNLKAHLLTHKSPSEVKMFKCALCSYEAKRKHHLKGHLLTHNNSSEIKMRDMKQNRKTKLNKHLMTHKNPSEINTFKCEMCLYETKYKFCLERHLSTHKSHRSPLEIKRRNVKFILGDTY